MFVASQAAWAIRTCQNASLGSSVDASVTRNGYRKPAYPATKAHKAKEVASTNRSLIGTEVQQAKGMEFNL